MHFNDWLKNKMASHDPPLDDVAVGRAVGVHKTTVGRWRDGSSLPEREHVAGLAMLFKVSATTIMRMTDNKALQEELSNEAGQQELAALLAHVPEMYHFFQLVWKMPPETRAALMLIARKMAGEP